jgi:hypothetical protein
VGGAGKVLPYRSSREQSLTKTLARKAAGLEEEGQGHSVSVSPHECGAMECSSLVFISGGREKFKES